MKTSRAGEIARHCDKLEVFGQPTACLAENSCLYPKNELQTLVKALNFWELREMLGFMKYRIDGTKQSDTMRGLALDR